MVSVTLSRSPAPVFHPSESIVQSRVAKLSVQNLGTLTENWGWIGWLLATTAFRAAFATWGVRTFLPAPVFHPSESIVQSRVAKLSVQNLGTLTENWGWAITWKERISILL